MIPPMSDPVPRPIRPGEEALVHALIDRCYREHGLVLDLADECEHHLLDPTSSFRAAGGEFWVVADDTGAIRATAALSLHRASQGPPVAELKSMYVDPAWRRRGWGRRLTNHVMAAARTAGCVRMELWSDTRFTAAHAMYAALGFVPAGRREVHDSNNSAELGFSRDL